MPGCLWCFARVCSDPWQLPVMLVPHYRGQSDLSWLFMSIFKGCFPVILLVINGIIC
jgi:hypothetical protein